jgi:hypothetical protein
VLICSAMTANTKVCSLCEKTLDQSAFSAKRKSKVCVTCKAQQQESRISKSYENFLRNLHSQSKSGNTHGTRNRDLAWDITSEDLTKLWEKQGGKCALSGVYLTHHKDGSGTKEYNASIDRISGEKGYTVQNTQLVCYRINIMKHTLSEDLFYWWVKTINDFSCD